MSGELEWRLWLPHEARIPEAVAIKEAVEPVLVRPTPTRPRTANGRPRPQVTRPSGHHSPDAFDTASPMLL